MSVTVSFNLPYLLKIDGDFEANVDGNLFRIKLESFREEEPNFHGKRNAIYSSNMSIIRDDTTIMGYTKVYAECLSSNIDVSMYPPDDLPRTLAIKISNRLICAAKNAFDCYELENIFHEKRIGCITYSISIDDRRESGIFDPLMGGVTFSCAQHQQSIEVFSSELLLESEVPAWKELYFDAKRYLLNKNIKMALINISISFELRMIGVLISAAENKDIDIGIESIKSLTLTKLGTGICKKIFKHSLDDCKSWGKDIVDIYKIFVKVRNAILHGAETVLVFDSVSRDFSKESEADALFSKYDYFFSVLQYKVSNDV